MGAAVVDLDEKLKIAESLPYDISSTNDNQNAGRGTCPIHTALPIIKKLLAPIGKFKVMEVGSGNGFNTREIAKLPEIESIDASDIQKHEPSYYDVAVFPADEFIKSNWTDEYNMLLMVSPTNDNVRLDYGSIKALEEKHTKPVYLMILGELGASDGTVGIYHYLTEGSDWVKTAEVPYLQNIDIFGEPVIKAVNLFYLE